MADELAPRLSRLLHAPDTIRGWWTSMGRPLLRWWGVRPSLSTRELQRFVALVTEARAVKGAGTPHADVAQRARDDALAKQQRAARAEFEANLRALERNQLVYRENDARQLGWVSRMYPLLLAAEQAALLLRSPEHGAEQRWLAGRAVRALERHAFLPLEAHAGAPAGRVERLRAIDVALDAADAERDFLGRRRALLSGARELLLLAAEHAREPEAVQARLAHVADRIADLDRVQASGIRMEVSLRHQLRTAWLERDAQQLNACLSALEAVALEGSDREIAELSARALSALWRDGHRSTREQRRASIARSGEQTLQPELRQAVSDAQALAATRWQSDRQENGVPRYNDAIERAVAQYLQGSPEAELIQAALYVDGCVDVGGVLTPHRIVETETLIREVRYPTQHMTLRDAEGVEDIPRAVISDPRAVLFDLASQRLLTRRYVGQEQRAVERRVMATEVRIYLLDGSGSMLGPRARMRDAILVAELSTMIARLNQRERWLTPTLYYRYFTLELGPVQKVNTAEQAISAVEDALGRVRHGGTDIQGALLESFELLRAAVADDPELYQAQIVLLTDGEAGVDEAAVLAARERVGSLPIGVSIIALGQENPALRKIAAAQRERGERVFYQFIPDALLERMTQGEHTSLCLHLPEELAKRPLQEDLGLLVREIEMSTRKRDEDALAGAHDEVAALSEIGLRFGELPETERMRILALSRDRDTLERRFATWFPELAAVGDAASRLSPSSEDAARIDETLGVLQSVQEITELVASGPLRRSADAVELLERLLLDRGMNLPEYQRLLRRYPERFRTAIELVRAVCTRQ